MFNPTLIMVQESMGEYQAVKYTPALKIALGAVALFYVMAQVYVSKLYYLMKASWARVALNLQIIVTFIFDTVVAGV